VDGQSARPQASFARVDVATGERAVQAASVTEASATPAAKPQAQVPAIAMPRAKGLIEIVLPGGTSVRVDAHVDDRALRCVLDAMQAR
jgi:hypothetical protein